MSEESSSSSETRSVTLSKIEVNVSCVTYCHVLQKSRRLDLFRILDSSPRVFRGAKQHCAYNYRRNAG